MFPPLIWGSELRLALAIGPLADGVSRSVEGLYMGLLLCIVASHDKNMALDPLRNMRKDWSKATPDKLG